MSKNNLPPTSFIDFNGNNVCIGDSYYPVNKTTLKVYEPFTAHQETKTQLSDDCFYFSSLTSANNFVLSKKTLDKEFSRYKQDCRKRALDLAATEHTEWIRNKNSARVVASENANDIPPNIIDVADKYYKWLTQIPDSN